MKKFIVLLGIVLPILLLSACTNEEPNASTDNYYIKYEAKANSRLGHWIESVSVTTNDGGYSSNKRTAYWCESFGPVQKGFEARISVSGEYPTTRIYVSKEQGPFVLKAEGKYSTSYTIDF